VEGAAYVTTGGKREAVKTAKERTSVSTVDRRAFAKCVEGVGYVSTENNEEIAEIVEEAASATMEVTSTDVPNAGS
jgi:hypothetical protein